MTLNWISPFTLGGNSMQQPVSTFDQEQSDHWEVLADMAYYQRLAMQEELDEDDIPIGWLITKPSECQQINTTQSEDCS
jgi:hypothetical protein